MSVPSNRSVASPPTSSRRSTNRCIAWSGSGPTRSSTGSKFTALTGGPRPGRKAGAFLRFAALYSSPETHGKDDPPMARLSALLLALLLTATAGVAHAQTDYPARSVKLVVPFAAGGPTDVVARILADMLSVRWGGQSIVIENRPGAGTIVAT